MCAFILCITALLLQLHAQHYNDSNAKPPVTEADVRIVQRAREILNTPETWNRNDNRHCRRSDTTFSIYCALEKATVEETGGFQHRGAAMQEARFVIDDMVPRNRYPHRLMGFNNDPATSFADMQKMLRLLEERVAKRLAKETKHK
ncbi:MAG: hypothetical protein JSS87_15005 [Acidobacteria bacterium]|nr:hypothetical protein [Acidobacteriota bacterium]